MILDIETILSNNQAITATATSTGVYDTAGVGIGQPAPLIFGQTFGGATSFGNDIGSGGPWASAPQLAAYVGTAFTAAGAATLQVQLQAAVDVSNTGLPVTWDTLLETDTYALATLTAGQKIADFTVPPRYPGQGLPRFYRLNYVVATGPMTAGTITAQLETGIDNLLVTPANY